MMWRQQEGFKRTFPDAREQEIQMGQMAMGGAMGIHNRGAMPPAPVPAGTPAPPGPATMMPDGTSGLTPPTTEQPSCYNGRDRGNWWNTFCIQPFSFWS